MPSPLSPTDAPNHYWTAEVNDLVGGWIVTNGKQPASELHTRRTYRVDACPRCPVPHIHTDGGTDYVIAETHTEEDAVIIASALNRAGVRRP